MTHHPVTLYTAQPFNYTQDLPCFKHTIVTGRIRVDPLPMCNGCVVLAMLQLPPGRCVSGIDLLTDQYLNECDQCRVSPPAPDGLVIHLCRFVADNIECVCVCRSPQQFYVQDTDERQNP